MKRIFVMLVSASFVLLANAQLENIFKIGSTKLIEDAISGSLVIMSSSYQLREKETGELYGRGGRNTYGTVCDLGVAWEDGCIIGRKIVQPWKYDTAYDKYRDDARYEPVLVDTFSFRRLNMQETAKEKVSEIITVVKDSLYFLPLSGEDSMNVATSSKRGELNGWIIWCMVPTTKDLEINSKISITSVDTSIDTDNSSTFIVKAPNRGQVLLGGVFIVPSIDGIGKITLRPRGILQKCDDTWRIKLLNSKFSHSKNGGDDKRIEKAENPDKEELTPVKPKRKRKR